MIKKVLITTSENWDSTAEIPFMYKKAGFEVDVCCQPNFWMTHNRFYSKLIKADKNIKKQALQIIELAKKDYDKIVISDDNLMHEINLILKEESLVTKVLPLTKSEHRDLLSSKTGFSLKCKSLGIPTPNFSIYNEKLSLEEQTNNLRFPILIKEDLSWAGAGIFFCKNIQELESILNRIPTKSGLLLQEFLTGKDIGIEALYHEGTLVAYNCSEVLTYMGKKFSVTTRRKYYANSEIRKHLQDIGEKMGINGFASIGILFVPEDNSYYLFEVDIRPNSWMASSRFAGNNFIEALGRIRNSLISGQPVIPLPEGTKTIEIALYFKDIKRCIKGGDVKGFLQWLTNKKGYWNYIPFYDYKLLRKSSFELLKFFFKRKILNKNKLKD